MAPSATLLRRSTAILPPGVVIICRPLHRRKDTHGQWSGSTRLATRELSWRWAGFVTVFGMTAPADSDTWIGIDAESLDVEGASKWVVRPDCGAVVVFSGTARDHSPGREDVSLLEYEAYESQALARMGEIAEAARDRWPDIGRIAMLHRVGAVEVGESAVVVAVSSPHRGAAFEAARFGIDTLKSSVPIWKREEWATGKSWGLEAQHIVDVAEAANQATPPSV